MSSQKQQPAKTSKLDQLRERQQNGSWRRRAGQQHASGKVTARGGLISCSMRQLSGIR
jgi:hypothetical protein